MKRSAIYLGWQRAGESQVVERLLSHALDLVYSEHFEFGDDPDQRALAALRSDFLFSFGPIIVRTPLLRSVRVASINFHPAPPRWPGRGSCSFALLAGDEEFGITAHIMDREVDAGPIIRVVRFPIPIPADVETLHAEALRRVPELARRVIEDLRICDWNQVPALSEERWERQALRQRDLMAAMEITHADSQELVERKVRAFAHPHKPGPYVVLGNRRFWYLKGHSD